MSGEKPHYHLKALRPSTQDSPHELKGRVGAAWRKPDGSIFIALDPFVELRGDGDLILTLFPVDDRPAPTTTNIPAPRRR